MTTTLTREQFATLKQMHDTALTAEDKGFQTDDLKAEAQAHGYGNGLRATLAVVLGVNEADVEALLDGNG